MDFESLQLADYDALCEALNFPSDWPDGLLAHGSVEVDGKLRMPLILTGVKLAVGLGLILIVIVIVIAEMLGAKSGLGYMIWNAWQIFSVETGGV